MCTFMPGGDPRLPDVGDGYCCDGRIDDGPAFCTCWTPEFDLEQQPVDQFHVQALAVGFPPPTRALMCGDCAYRPGSPERTGSEQHAGDTEALERYAAGERERFFCHQGIRRPVRLRHPSGAVIPGGDADYRPPIRDGVPWRADGTPAELCAGWAARRRALEARADA